MPAVSTAVSAMEIQAFFRAFSAWAMDSSRPGPDWRRAQRSSSLASSMARPAM